jgi:hypothetical protein
MAPRRLWLDLVGRLREEWFPGPSMALDSRETERIIVLGKSLGDSQNMLRPPEELRKPGSRGSGRVLSGTVYKIRLGIRSHVACLQALVLDVGLDTCGGCNLIRKDSVPPGSTISSIEYLPTIQAAQGEALKILGVVSLILEVGGPGLADAVSFLVVSDLVVPALLGTPWINENVLRIESRTKEVVLDSRDNREIGLPIRETSGRSVVRVAQAMTIPAFSEMYTPACTNRSGLSLIRPPYREAHDYVHSKKRNLELSTVGKSFDCLVANFSSRTLTLRKNQVIGVSEGQTIALCSPSYGDQHEFSWEGVIRDKLSHLSNVEAEMTIETLRPFSRMWDGHLG